MPVLKQMVDFQAIGQVKQPSGQMPVPQSGERPIHYADRVGEWYVAGRSDKQRKDYGLFLTPTAVADYMASRIMTNMGVIRALDPAAGAGILCCAAVEALVSREQKPVSIEVVAFEIDAGLIAPLRAVLDYLSDWCAHEHGVDVAVRVRVKDFILANALVLEPDGLWLTQQAGKSFDIVIANPPYFKIGKHDPRAVAASGVVHGQPNIYALFMAVAAAMLRERGDFVFITPRSFASGPYFHRFRNVFFGMIRPTAVHVFDCRRSAFRRDAVLQENIIISGRREDGWPKNGAGSRLMVSSSSGVRDLAAAQGRDIPLRTVLDLNSVEKVLRLPLCESDENALALIESWPSSLENQGLRISTGPVVPFRAAEFTAREGKVPESHVPLLWMNHVRAMQAIWPIARHKPEYIACAGAEKLLVPNRNYVLIRRFSAKEERRRLTAAPYLASKLPVPRIGLENHLNYIHRPGGDLSADEAWGLAALYNSKLLDTWFRTINGNTQVSATELRGMRLPASEVIVSLGRKVRKMREPMENLDELVSEYFAPTEGRVAAIG